MEKLKKGSGCDHLLQEKAHFFPRSRLSLPASGGCGLFVKEETVYTDCLGAMPDCSRNGVPTPDMLKRMIRTMALLGMNELFLYTEDTYELPEYPYFGAFRGRFTKEELKECDAYGANFRYLSGSLYPDTGTFEHFPALAGKQWPAGQPGQPSSGGGKDL